MKKIRLFCFPYAGRGASMYTACVEYFKPAIEVIALQLPGREERVLETPCVSMPSLVEDCLEQMRFYLDLPFAFFGHCLGAFLAYELALKIEDELNRTPMNFFVSSCPAPHIHYVKNPVHALSGEIFLEKINAISVDDRNRNLNANISTVLLPTLKSDFALYENYVHVNPLLLPCPIYVFSGLNDAYVTTETVMAWEKLTTQNFKSQSFLGDHLYIHHALLDVMAVVKKELLL